MTGDPFEVRRPKGALATALRSPSVLAVILRVGWLSVTLGIAVIGWELLLGEFSSFFALAAMASLVLMVLRGDLRPRMIPDLTSAIPRVAVSSTVGMGTALLVNLAFSLRPISGEWLLSQLATLAVAAWIGVWLGLRSLRREWQRGGLRSRTIMIGSSDMALEFAMEITQRPAYGVDLLGWVEPTSSDAAVAGSLGGLAQLPELVGLLSVDRILVMPGTSANPDFLRALRWAIATPGLTVFVVPRLFELGMGMDSVSPDRVRGYPLTQLDRVSHREFGLLGKRMFDVSVAGLALVLLSPLLLLVAFLVKVTDPSGPVFFRQDRVGRYGERFSLLKFRSMRQSSKSDSEWMGEAETRVTRLGSFLRRSSLDEIPQLINVVRGDMSLVGPRPERPHFVEEFSATVPGYVDRLRMPVGLTGLAQIVGLRGDTSIEQRAKYDNIYIEQWRFLWDIEILVKTIAAILRADSYAEDQDRVDRLLQSGSVPSFVRVDVDPAHRDSVGSEEGSGTR